MIPIGASYKRYVISNKQLRFRVDKTKADPNYVFQWLASPWIFKTITNRNTGSTVPLINLGIIKSLPIELPENVSEQKKIAGTISKIDAKIELNNRINIELETMAKTLYDYWFVQFDFPDANGKPYKTSGGKMVYNTTLKREIPEGWEVVDLEHIAHVVKGNVLPDEIDSTTPYIGLEHIPRKTIILSEWETAEKVNSDKCAFQKYDILFGKIRPYFHKVGIAFVDGITSTDTIVLRPKKKEFFGLALETVFTEKFIATATQSSTGTKMPRADWGVLRSYKVPLPTFPLLYKYQKIFDGLLVKMEASVYQNKELVELRDWLLPMLMNGQVTVK